MNTRVSASTLWRATCMCRKSVSKPHTTVNECVCVWVCNEVKCVDVSGILFGSHGVRAAEQTSHNEPMADKLKSDLLET